MYGLAKSLASYGFKVTVFADGVKSDNHENFEIRRFWGIKFLRKRIKAWKAIKYIKGPTYIFADSWKSLELLPDFLKDKCRIICFMHGMEFPSNPSKIKHKRIFDSLGKAHILFSNSNYTANSASRFSNDKSKIKVIEPCIDQPLKASEEELANIRNIFNNGLNLVTISRLEPRKGIDRTIESLSILKKEFPNITYAVAGSGDDLDRLKELTSNLGVSDHVYFMGRVSEVKKAALLESAQIFVMPVRREGDSVEGFGASYIEAGWYSLPSIAGNSGGAGEAVNNLITGIVIQDTTPENIASAVSMLLKDKELRQNLGENARKKAQSLIWEKGFQRYLNLI